MAAPTLGLAVVKTGTTLATFQDALGSLAGRYKTDEVLTAVRHLPAREAQFRAMPAWVKPELLDAYRAKGIEQLFSHQAEAAELAHSGKDFVVVTPTASGKTLCYNLPVLSSVLETPDTRALYLFPTKALAQDQLAELHDLATRLDDCFGVFTYDGDTPSDARRAIRERGHVVLSNPDMLHTGILPHHTKWTRLFECATAASARCEILRVEAAIHLLLGNDCESGGAGFAADRARSGSGGREWRARC
jgi:DEAD/DEAH box helicase domain-containing protein